MQATIGALHVGIFLEMKIRNKQQFLKEKDHILREIKQGAIIIYPTDTIYGIGCDATNSLSVKKIRELKGRFEKPFSIIAPSKRWIMRNCNIKREQKQFLEKLPGPYTLILQLKKNVVSSQVTLGLETIGVRIPRHWFSEVVRELNIPFVTSSVNKAGEQYMTSLENGKRNIIQKVNYIIYEGEKRGKPSVIIDVTKEQVEYKQR